MASNPELLERPAHSKKAKAAPKAKSPASECGPTIASLQAKVDRAARQGPQGRDLGEMTHAQRDKYLFG